MPVAYEFSPQLVLVSAGFDAAVGDPLSGYSEEIYNISIKNKFALLWGEAQLCLPYVCLWKKIAYSYPNVNYSGLRVTYS